MTNRSKQRGTAFETLIVNYLKRWYPLAKRNPLAGVNDVGDIYLPTEGRFILELKNVSRQDLPGWVAEAQCEAINYDKSVVGKSSGRCIGVVVHKRKGKGDPAQQWVTMELGDFMDLVNETNMR